MVKTIWIKFPKFFLLQKYSISPLQLRIKSNFLCWKSLNLCPKSPFLHLLPPISSPCNIPVITLFFWPFFQPLPISDWFPSFQPTCSHLLSIKTHKNSSETRLPQLFIFIFNAKTYPRHFTLLPLSAHLTLIPQPLILAFFLEIHYPTKTPLVLPVISYH